MSAEASSMLRGAIAKYALSGRAHHRVLRVARTIADLEGAPRVEKPHVGEALAYRGNAIGTSLPPGANR